MREAFAIAHFFIKKYSHTSDINVCNFNENSLTTSLVLNNRALVFVIVSQLCACLGAFMFGEWLMIHYSDLLPIVGKVSSRKLSVVLYKIF